ncbi:hypothetical protein HK405_015504, partial [Cladochytrium tenue]
MGAGIVAAVSVNGRSLAGWSSLQLAPLLIVLRVAPDGGVFVPKHPAHLAGEAAAETTAESADLCSKCFHDATVDYLGVPFAALQGYFVRNVLTRTLYHSDVKDHVPMALLLASSALVASSKSVSMESTGAVTGGLGSPPVIVDKSVNAITLGFQVPSGSPVLNAAPTIRDHTQFNVTYSLTEATGGLFMSVVVDEACPLCRAPTSTHIRSACSATRYEDVGPYGWTCPFPLVLSHIARPSSRVHTLSFARNTCSHETVLTLSSLFAAHEDPPRMVNPGASRILSLDLSDCHLENEDLARLLTTLASASSESVSELDGWTRDPSPSLYLRELDICGNAVFIDRAIAHALAKLIGRNRTLRYLQSDSMEIEDEGFVYPLSRSEVIDCLRASLQTNNRLLRIDGWDDDVELAEARDAASARNTTIGSHRRAAAYDCLRLCHALQGDLRPATPDQVSLASIAPVLLPRLLGYSARSVLSSQELRNIAGFAAEPGSRLPAGRGGDDE